MQSFFVPAEAIADSQVAFSDNQTRQMTSVLRMGKGDRVYVLDNSGWRYEAEVTELGRSGTKAKIISRTLADTEPRTKITLYQGLLKADHFELVLQKATEIGVCAFVPMICERSVVGSVSVGKSAKIERWERIIVEAAEQSRRAKLPQLAPAELFRSACESARGVSIIPWEEEKGEGLGAALRRLAEKAKAQQPASSRPDRQTARSRPLSINIFIGPEGGFSKDEIDYALLYNIVPVTLGPRILRAETAAIVAAANALYELNDLG